MTFKKKKGSICGGTPKYPSFQANEPPKTSINLQDLKTDSEIDANQLDNSREICSWYHWSWRKQEIIRTDCSIKSFPPQNLFILYPTVMHLSSHACLLKLGGSSPLRMKGQTRRGCFLRDHLLIVVVFINLAHPGAQFGFTHITSVVALRWLSCELLSRLLFGCYKISQMKGKSIKKQQNSATQLMGSDCSTPET